MSHVWTAPSWQGESSRRIAGRCSRVFDVEQSIYYDVPILAEIDPKKFVDVVLNLKPGSQRAVFTTFRGRYEAGQLKRELVREQSWLDEVRQKFRSAIKDLPPLSKFRVENYVRQNIDPFSAIFGS
jgi:hypothetical protein